MLRSPKFSSTQRNHIKSPTFEPKRRFPERKMAPPMTGVNTAKTSVVKPPFSIPSFTSASLCTGKTTLRMLSASSSSSLVKASLTHRQDSPHNLSLDALIKGDRREEVVGAINRSLSNCLSETNLHLTVPGIKSKTRGKVIFC